MKKSILTIAYLLICTLAIAQAPSLINYQAVARDLSGNPLVSTPVTVVFEIRQTSPLGTIVYNETHVSTTNQFGLFNLEIGGGTPITGSFASINWSTGLYYLRVTVNGDVMPSTQLLSVPFALHASTASNGTPGHNSLSDSLAEPAGTNCANGGYLITMGTDLNDDGILQAGEINISYYLCNGIDGTNGVDGVDGIDGTNGIDGIDGTNGIGINWLGAFSTPPLSPSQNDAYYNDTDGISYIWDGATWNTLAQDGASVNWLGAFVTAPLTPSQNDAYYNSTDGVSYIWDGATWNMLAQDGASTTYTAGSGINIAGNVITNTGDLDP
ncbi:MAG: hypothetical protein A3K10_10215, partial [Bacteroidetes bacterium RIFCSPLOWO2_12_FULL_31_6]